MRPEARGATPGGWRIVAEQELRDLWLSSRGLIVLLGYTLLLSGMSYLAASDAQLNLLDARESVNIVVQLAIALGTLTALIISADAISGERERGTLEALLVTPLGRTDLVIGKLIAASTMWLASIVVAVPYVFALAQGTKVVGDAVVILVVVGALVAIALTALGVMVSALAPSNRASLASAVVVLLVMAAPSQLPAVSTSGPVGWLLLRANPVSAGLHLASKVLVAGESWSTHWTLLLAPLVAAAALSVAALFVARRIKIGALS